MTTHHGGESSKAIWGLAPRVAIMNNGPRKGGDPAGWKVIMGSPGIEDLWQLHFAIAGGKEANAPDPMIANVDEKGRNLSQSDRVTGWVIHGVQSTE